MSWLDQGFEIVPKVLDRSTVSSLIRAVEGSSVRRSRAGMRHALEIPAVKSLASSPKLLAIAKHVLGDHAFPFRATLFDKSLRSNWLVVWHQDTALPLRERKEVKGWGSWSRKEGVLCAHAPASALEQVLAVRVHLDDSTSENGALRVLPGTHNMGVLADDAILELAQRTKAVECPVDSRGVLLMRPLMVHASSKSINESRRRVLHIEYAATRCLPGGLELCCA